LISYNEPKGDAGFFVVSFIGGAHFGEARPLEFLTGPIGLLQNL